MVRPLLAIVTGRPGSGKSTLAAQLAESLRCPHVSRDRIKEGALRTLGHDAAADPDLSQRVCEAFFEVIRNLVQVQVGVVAEAAFQHKVWAPRLTPFLAVSDTRVIVCEVEGDVAAARRAERTRKDPLWERYHPVPQGWDPDSYDPPRLDVPTLTVDTTRDYEPGLQDILRFLS